MRILVISNLYPPIVLGGYEAECALVVEHLRAVGHDVCVLTSDHRAGDAPAQAHVRRTLPFLTIDARGALRAPGAAVRAARVTRATLAELEPDLVYQWNGSQIPQVALRIALDSGLPVAVRVCEQWFGQIFALDQFLRYLSGRHPGAPRGWAALTRAVNRHPALRIEPGRPARAAVCWNSEALRASAGMPSMLEAVLESVVHSTAARGPAFAAAPRRPPPPGTPPELAYVGRVDAAKGADVAVRALVALHAQHGIDATLTLAGVVTDGFRAQLGAVAAAGGLDPAATLRFLGPVDTGALVDLLSRAAVMLVPSVSFDAFPQVCLEGALARIPVVGSDVGGIPECLHHEEHALIHPPGDAEACAAAIARTLQEPQETAARVDRARRRGEDLDTDWYLGATERFVHDAHAALTR